jgi:hypothetical protein
MPEVSINLLAVLIAAVINMVLGALWYSPVLFAKPWLAALGKTEEEVKQKSPGPIYAINTIGNLVLAYVLAHIIDYAHATTVVQGAQTGFWIWIGFLVPTLLTVYMFEMRNIKLYFIFITYQLIALVLEGIILAIWV